MIFIFSYERPEMLEKVLETLKGESLIVMDDGSSFDLDKLDCNYIQFDHMGRPGYWRIWNYVLDYAKDLDDDFYMFTPDDFLDLDLDRIKKLHAKYKGSPYVYNIINDGRDQCFINTPVRKINKDTIEVGFTDCGFFCNREALELLEFKLAPIPMERFKTEGVSSGVGSQLTRRWFVKKVPMYKPIKSLAFHGDHESKMHKAERKLNPLISN